MLKFYLQVINKSYPPLSHGQVYSVVLRQVADQTWYFCAGMRGAMFAVGEKEVRNNFNYIPESSDSAYTVLGTRCAFRSRGIIYFIHASAIWKGNAWLVKELKKKTA